MDVSNDIHDGSGPSVPDDRCDCAAPSLQDDSLAGMRQAHAAKLVLCERLEAIADSLPNELSRRECLLAARALGPMLCRIHRFEEERIFPVYRAHRDNHPEAIETIERLKDEHLEDEGYAAELREALRDAARIGKASAPETLGFMLRGFFGAIRRHVAFEREHVLAALLVERI